MVQMPSLSAVFDFILIYLQTKEKRRRGQGWIGKGRRNVNMDNKTEWGEEVASFASTLFILNFKL
jgi:hypothetical protein